MEICISFAPIVYASPCTLHFRAFAPPCSLYLLELIYSLDIEAKSPGREVSLTLENGKPLARASYKKKSEII